jgi:hypothetical protein
MHKNGVGCIDREQEGYQNNRKEEDFSALGFKCKRSNI